MANRHPLVQSSARETIRRLGDRLLAIVTSRTVVVISTSCAILYAALWLIALLQTNGLISTILPVGVSEKVVEQRSGGEMRPAALSVGQQAERSRGLAEASQAPGESQNDSPFTLEVQSEPPVLLWVTDARGGEVGTNPQTGLVRLQIPGASYSGRGSSPQLVAVPHAEGQYRIQLVATGNTHYQLSVRLMKGQDVETSSQYSGTGEMFSNTVLETTADVGIGSDGASQLTVTPLRVIVAGDVPASPTAAPAASAPDAGNTPSPEATGLVQPASASPRPQATPTAAARRSSAPRLPIPIPVPALAPAPPSTPES